MKFKKFEGFILFLNGNSNYPISHFGSFGGGGCGFDRVGSEREKPRQRALFQNVKLEKLNFRPTLYKLRD